MAPLEVQKLTLLERPDGMRILSFVCEAEAFSHAIETVCLSLQSRFLFSFY